MRLSTSVVEICYSKYINMFLFLFLFGNRNVIVLTTLDERAIVLSNRLSWCIKKERRKKGGGGKNKRREERCCRVSKVGVVQDRKE